MKVSRRGLYALQALIHLAEAYEAGLVAAQVREEKVEEVSQDLRDLEGLTPELIAKLAGGSIHTRDDLADLAVDELSEMTGMEGEQAKTLIIAARAHWFADEPAAQPAPAAAAQKEVR